MYVHFYSVIVVLLMAVIIIAAMLGLYASNRKKRKKVTSYIEIIHAVMYHHYNDTINSIHFASHLRLHGGCAFKSIVLKMYICVLYPHPDLH